jgi:hypothetical protein
MMALAAELEGQFSVVASHMSNLFVVQTFFVF